MSQTLVNPDLLRPLHELLFSNADLDASVARLRTQKLVRVDAGPVRLTPRRARHRGCSSPCAASAFCSTT